MKDLLYLVQGQSDLVKDYFHLSARPNADAIFLTYDKQIKNAIFLPESTWAEGRNKLLETALKKEDYLYYIFCDDDIEFHKGGWDKFEKDLLFLKPAIAVPVFLKKTKNTPLRWVKYHSILFNDEQMMAFHNEVVRDGIVLPYQNQFDHIHWWASCQLQQILIQNFYAYSSIQLNGIQIINKYRHRYHNSDKGRNEYQKHIRDWLSKQFRNNYNDINMSIKKSFHIIIWRTLIYFIRHRFHIKVPIYSVNENTVRKKLSDDSELLIQHIEYRTINKDDNR